MRKISISEAGLFIGNSSCYKAEFLDNKNKELCAVLSSRVPFRQEEASNSADRMIAVASFLLHLSLFINTDEVV